MSDPMDAEQFNLYKSIMGTETHGPLMVEFKSVVPMVESLRSQIEGLRGALASVVMLTDEWPQGTMNREMANQIARSALDGGEGFEVPPSWTLGWLEDGTPHQTHCPQMEHRGVTTEYGYMVTCGCGARWTVPKRVTREVYEQERREGPSTREERP